MNFQIYIGAYYKCFEDIHIVYSDSTITNKLQQAIIRFGKARPIEHTRAHNIHCTYWKQRKMADKT
jgi:hypothetical protein